MNEQVGLAAVSTSSLERIRGALADGRLRTPLTRADLVGQGIKGQLDTLVAVLQGHGREACVAILDAVLAERSKLDRPDPELVWTGPEGAHAAARDTAVVLRELFKSARERVILAGYSFREAPEVLGPLHQSMKEHGVRAMFFVQVDQAEGPVSDPDQYGRAELRKFLAQNWPFDDFKPELFCDRRALTPGPPWSSLHAKCVAVDGQRAFVSSANFTSRGQERNIETGVLLEDPAFAGQLERQWLSLVSSGLVLKL